MGTWSYVIGGYVIEAHGTANHLANHLAAWEALRHALIASPQICDT
jgi:hypothetical protein